MMKVLLFTNKEDVTTDFIVLELKRQNEKSYLAKTKCELKKHLNDI